ncbi:unnamed protein product [Lepeophtheirus salmonis]|uniref:(salmon louse) hypothetical protein n=1 Tax=Lepeophtheirus salmonis TaxID=72036 RepID=A0A7R8H7Y0_LEPSM|nr:unnamed protein product [Lepeophtheirus salmonis]CAF2927388.1 unnamed protein product [Lepeophtheirus salmonis]
MESAEDNLREVVKSKIIFSSEYMVPKDISKPKSKVSRKIKPFNEQESTPREGKCIFCGNVHFCKYYVSNTIQGNVSTAITSTRDKRAFAKLSVDGRRIKFLLDLVANINSLPSFLVCKSVDRKNAGSIKVF